MRVKNVLEATHKPVPSPQGNHDRASDLMKIVYIVVRVKTLFVPVTII